MQRIVPCIWFDTQAEDAARFYTSVFERGKLGDVVRYDEASARASGQPEGSVLTVEFEIEGYAFTALNGGPVFRINPSISFFVDCPTHADVDELWGALSDGGAALMPLDRYPFAERYGWVQDRYGVSWQLMAAPARSQRRIRPSLMFVGDNAGRADEAIGVYTRLFANARRGASSRYGEGQEPDAADTLAYGEFELHGQPFVAMDSGYAHAFDFNEAISLQVLCDSQEEVDAYWEALSAVPSAERCGWLKDPFGVSWQVVPAALLGMLKDPDPERAGRVMRAMLPMKKLEIARLQAAYDGAE